MRFLAFRSDRSEKEEVTLCDQLVAQVGGQRVSFSQARETNQTFGISDRRYRIKGCAFWWEAKKATGPGAKLTKYQDEFLAAEAACGCLGGAGTFDDLKPIVQALVGGDRTKGEQLLAHSLMRMRAKGYR